MVACVHVAGFGLAVEMQESPLLAGKSLALLHSAALPLVAEASPAACAAGVSAGMCWADAAACCAGLARIEARPDHYARRSARLADALTVLTPDVEAFAPGTFFLDLTPCQSYYRHDPQRIAVLVHEQCRAAGMPAAGVGIGGDRTTARVAAERAGAGGTQVVAPGAAAAFLAPLTPQELCGAGPQVTGFLASLDIHTCGDLARLPADVLAQRLGDHGRRLWLMAQGRDPAPVRPRAPTGHGGNGGLLRTLPPACHDEAALQAALLQLAARLLPRLLREGWDGHELRVGLRAPEGWRRAVVAVPDRLDAGSLAPPIRRFLRRQWFGEDVRQLHLQPALAGEAAWQDDFFLPRARRRQAGGRRA